MSLPTLSSSAEVFFSKHAEVSDTSLTSRTYDQRRRRVLESVEAELATLKRPPDRIDLLDFGCGAGVLLADLAELGVRISGVDSSRSMIEKTRRRLASIESEQINLELLRDSSGTGCYQNRSYDIVICTSVLEFVPDMGAILSKLSACLRSGGVLVLSVPNRRSVLRWLEKLVYRHPKPFRSFHRLRHLTSRDSYLSVQKRQLTLAELTSIAEGYGLRKGEHRFHVAPQMLGSLEQRSSIGMMLMAVFRK